MKYQYNCSNPTCNLRTGPFGGSTNYDVLYLWQEGKPFDEQNYMARQGCYNCNDKSDHLEKKERPKYGWVRENIYNAKETKAMEAAARKAAGLPRGGLAVKVKVSAKKFAAGI